MTSGLLLMKALVRSDNSVDGIAGQTGPVQHQFPRQAFSRTPIILSEHLLTRGA